MKRIIFLLAFLYGAALMAQNKAVAVTEVVDKQDKVSYATEIMVRTRLTAAISMKQGYTAYDRVDLQSIMSEQNFQRTGLVDDATIKRLGEMTGASLILIPEVAMSDDGKIYVAVKMLDVTTAQTMMVTGQLMGSSSEAVEEGCRSLAMKILGEGSRTTNTTVSTTEPVTLFGYLHVFPTDIGEFQTLPAQLLSAINRQAQYGYDTWRLPTTEELSIMRANSHLIPNFKNASYLCSNTSVKGYARLVTTDMTVSERQYTQNKETEARKKAIFSLLGVPYGDADKYYIVEGKTDRGDVRALVTIYKHGDNNRRIELTAMGFDYSCKYGLLQDYCLEYVLPREHNYFTSDFQYREENGEVYCRQFSYNGRSAVELHKRGYTPLTDKKNVITYSIWHELENGKVKQYYEISSSPVSYHIYFKRLPSEKAIRQEMQKYY